ncbi:hypothetical protein VTJ49DRAFT_4683 [Mycothermus thermophilus]|uniref:Uncharacterized protein n=1 Tax=Humicola insolens TaxID=85995 RepID=A0ABR3VMJ5_HUMIN
MRLSTFQAALGLLAAQPAAANLGHRHAHGQYARRHGHGHTHSPRAGEVISSPKEARGAGCQLPDHPDLVRVPGAQNNGFAMSPDEPCVDGKWCPIACKPGKVMAQWKPNTKYSYPESMYGGLYCNGGAVKAVNKAGSIVSFCQTVLPGNEAMIIPTDVNDVATLAVPGADYWAGTAAHYYVNAPGISASRGCVWGTADEPVGNWAAYVAGANTKSDGTTFVKIAWNPVYLDEPRYQGVKPTYGLRIECPGGGCNGLPCSIDPSKGGYNKVDSPVATSGVSDASFCVVTVPKGQTANIVVFNTDGSQGPPAGGDKEPEKSSSKEPEPTKSTEDPKPTKKVPVVATSNAADSSAPSSSSKNSHSTSSSSSSTTSDDFYGGVFQELDAQGATTVSPGTPDTTPQPAETQSPDEVRGAVSPTSSNEGAAAEGGSAIAGLVVALVAAAALI